VQENRTPLPATDARSGIAAILKELGHVEDMFLGSQLRDSRNGSAWK